MKISTRGVVVVLLLSALAAAQAPARAASSGGSELQAVLSAMDRASAEFKTAQADFNWDQYTRVVDTHDYQKGTICFRRAGRGLQMSARVTDPAAKYVLYTDSKVEVYEPKIDQVTRYDTGKNKADFESFLAIGFGGSGRELEKAFDVAYGGKETIDGVVTERLELTPKTQKGRNVFSHITLWIDPARGVSLQQKLEEGSGDYRLARYSNIRINGKLADVFKLPTTGKTRYINPQG